MRLARKCWRQRRGACAPLLPIRSDLKSSLQLPRQRDAGGVVARRLGGCAQAGASRLAQAVGAQQQAARCAQATSGIGAAQLQALAAQAAAVVVGLVQQVAHLQPGLGLGGVQAGAQLLRGVIEHQLVVAAATKLLALDAAECGGVGLAGVALGGGARRCAVPGGAVAARAFADEVHLAGGRVVGRCGRMPGFGVCMACLSGC